MDTIPPPPPGKQPLFVPKRIGVGYSFNFANPAAWGCLIGGIVLTAVVIVGVVLLAVVLFR